MFDWPDLHPLGLLSPPSGTIPAAFEVDLWCRGAFAAARAAVDDVDAHIGGIKWYGVFGDSFQIRSNGGGRYMDIVKAAVETSCRCFFLLPETRKKRTERCDGGLYIPYPSSPSSELSPLAETTQYRATYHGTRPQGNTPPCIASTTSAQGDCEPLRG